MTPRLSALAAVLALVALAGCDSNGSTNALRDLDGTYTVGELLFDPNAPALADADVAAGLDAQTRFDILSGSGVVQFVVSRQGIRSLVTLDAVATRGRATFTARSDAATAAELPRLLLPRQFVLSYNPDAPGALTGTVSLQNVNLENLDPVFYRGQTDVSGTLRIRLDRTAR